MVAEQRDEAHSLLAELDANYRFGGSAVVALVEEQVKRAVNSRQPRSKVLGLRDVLDSGPAAYGLDSGIWTSPMITWVIEEEFDIHYHPGHVRKLLHTWGFSIQRPRRVLARADAAAQDCWHRRTYPALKEKPKRVTGR